MMLSLFFFTEVYNLHNLYTYIFSIKIKIIIPVRGISTSYRYTGITVSRVRIYLFVKPFSTEAVWDSRP